MILHDAIHQLSSNGRRRVVIFVDDLDRCLPENALQVLESMKLFFDVEGCVFIVGLDQDIAERAIAAKYGATKDPNAQGIASGSDYVKKIFQVPFALPPIFSQQLQEYLSNIEGNATLSDGQRDDFRRNVRRHLRRLASEDSFNPREIKRLINSYVLQLKMLSARLGDQLSPDIVLALQIMAFRPDWRELYDHLAADPRLFQLSLKDVLLESVQPSEVWLSGVKVALPPGLLDYLREDASAVLEVDDLQAYVSAAESTRRSDPSVRDARVAVNRLRRTTDAFSSGFLTPQEAASKFSSDIKRLFDLTVRRSRLSINRVQNVISQLESAGQEIERSDEDGLDRPVAEWMAKVEPLFNTLDNLLRELDRQISVGADA